MELKPQCDRLHGTPDFFSDRPSMGGVGVHDRLLAGRGHAAGRVG